MSADLAARVAELEVLVAEMLAALKGVRDDETIKGRTATMNAVEAAIGRLVTTSATHAQAVLPSSDRERAEQIVADFDEGWEVFLSSRLSAESKSAAKETLVSAIASALHTRRAAIERAPFQGPWEAANSDEHHWVVSPPLDSGVKPWFTAVVLCADEAMEARLAQIIKAAPDLLAAIKEAVEFQNEDTDCGTDNIELCSDRRCRDEGCMIVRVNRWRAAITKAEG